MKPVTSILAAILLPAGGAAARQAERVLVFPAVRVIAPQTRLHQVREIGIGAHFLASPHTLENCRGQYRTDVFPRMGRDDYEKANRAGAYEAARDRALRLMAADPPPGLPDDDARREIAAIVAAADADIIGKSKQVSGKREVI